VSDSQLIELSDSPDIGANDYVTAKNIAEKLHQHYPGHLWAVTCEGKKGIATIRNLMLSTDHPYVLHLKTIFGDPHLRCVLRAGGHLLEAYKQRRGRVDHDAIDSLPRMANGFPALDPESLKPKARRSYLRELARNAWNKIQLFQKS
jgi:hypothetical protein